MGSAERRSMSRKKGRGGGLWNPRNVGPFDIVFRNANPLGGRGRHVKQRIEIGDRFGALVVTGWLKRPEGDYVRADVVVQCSCKGPEEIKRRSDFRLVRFSGCTVCARKMFIDNATARAWRDICENDAVRLKLITAIYGALGRCHNPKYRSWKHYGARGIQVFWLWHGDEGPRTFLRYLTTLPGHDNLTLELDRINNDGNYEPENLCFSTRKKQMLNRRKINDFETIRTGLRFAGLWPSEPLYDTYANGALSFGA